MVDGSSGMDFLDLCTIDEKIDLLSHSIIFSILCIKG